MKQEQIDFPFAFIATYAVQNPDKTVTHKPLKFALSEYKENQDKLHELARYLLEKETITGEEFMQILNE